MNDLDSAHISMMTQALRLAKTAAEQNEVPVGALIVANGQILVESFNQKESAQCVTEHAEIIAIRRASELKSSWRLTDCTMYVTLEPCLMCAGAILAARIPTLYFGAQDPKGGATVSLYNCLTDPRLNHQVEVHSGLLAKESSALLSQFFKARRSKN